MVKEIAVSTRAGTVRCLRVGDSRGTDLHPAIMVHGSGGRADIWTPVLPLFRMIAPFAIDLPGHGGSYGDPVGSVRAAAEVIEDVRLALGLPKTAVIGHSLGGAIGQQYAVDFADRCSALIICNSGCKFAIDEAALPRIVAEWPASAEHFAKGQVSPAATPEALNAARAMVLQRDPEVLKHDLELCAKFDSSDWAGTIRVPTLIVTSYEDRLTPFADSVDMLARIPGAQFTAVGPAGHAIFIEHPIRFVAAIESFFEETGISGSPESQERRG